MGLVIFWGVVPWLCLTQEAWADATPIKAPGRKTSNSANGAPLPFRVGEKLTYDIRWYGVTAGLAELTVKAKTHYNGHEVYHLVSRATGAGVVGKLYTVDDRLEVFVDVQGLYPYYASLRQKEGKRKKDKEVYFDQDRREVTYITNRGRPRTLSVPPEVKELLSSLYYFRTQGLKVGSTVPLNVFSLKRSYTVEVKVLRKETIETFSGPAETYVIQPHVSLNGQPQTREESLIWLTADERRLPVKIKTKVRLGYIEATLIGYAEQS